MIVRSEPPLLNIEPSGQENEAIVPCVKELDEPTASESSGNSGHVISGKYLTKTSI